MSLHLHPFDRAITLEPEGEQTWRARTAEDYWNFIGPYGGITAAQALRAVLQHPRRQGDVLAFTFNYAAALSQGEFLVHCEPARVNRSTQHWSLTLSQQGAVVATATALTGARRDTWSAQEIAPPLCVPPSGLQREAVEDLAWMQRYDVRVMRGGMQAIESGTSREDTTSILWVRDHPARPLDACALTAMADVFYPRIWLRRSRQALAGTVTLTLYFHASSNELQEVAEGFVLARARASCFRSGFFDQTGDLWSGAGNLLATTHQLVYFKEPGAPAA